MLSSQDCPLAPLEPQRVKELMSVSEHEASFNLLKAMATGDDTVSHLVISHQSPKGLPGATCLRVEMAPGKPKDNHHFGGPPILIYAHFGVA